MVPIYKLRRDIIHVCQRMYRRGYVAANDGNVSARVSDDRILITPSGMSKGFLEEDQLVLCDMEGKVISGSLKPSSELPMHLMAYRERPDVNAVVHAHPVVATGFAVAGIPLAQCVLPEVVLTVGAVPVAEYGTPSTEEVPESIKKYIQNYDAFLLANHGALTVGPDVITAYHRMETVEHFAQITLVARQLGRVNVLSDEQVQKLMQVREKLGIKGRNPLSCRGCTASCPNRRASEPPSGDETTSEDDLVGRIVSQVLARLEGGR